MFVLHDDGTMASYLHLSEDGVLVAVGDEVETGQAIGLVGTTGTSVPPLHFEVFEGQGEGTQWYRTVPVSLANAHEPPDDWGGLYKVSYESLPCRPSQYRHLWAGVEHEGANPLTYCGCARPEATEMGTGCTRRSEQGGTIPDRRAHSDKPYAADVVAPADLVCSPRYFRPAGALVGKLPSQTPMLPIDRQQVTTVQMTP